VCPGDKDVLISSLLLDSVISSSDTNKRIVKAMDDFKILYQNCIRTLEKG
jgi:hypothetical protein